MCLLCAGAAAQRIAVITPEPSEHTKQFTERLEDALAQRSKLLDGSLSRTAFLSAAVENPFNMTVADAKRVGSVIGCDFYLLVRTGNQRRTSLERAEYYEAFAAIYGVSSRTGRLAFWKMQKFEAGTAAEADKQLLASTETLAREIVDTIKDTGSKELIEKPMTRMEEPPEPGTKNFRSPVPYRRIKPEYTRLAYMYDVAATVDIELDIGEKGDILNARIVRWAGYGLDEAVERTVREMNWRPAERDSKPLPMRVLLRYNFKKID
jgi:Gram-negative bacterial TonB protein C-terminal